MNEDQVARWMVQEVDGTLPPAEREELFRHLAVHPELARELEEHRALAAVAAGWMRRLEADLRPVSERPRAVTLGPALVLAGWGLMAAGLVWTLAQDPEVPGWLLPAVALNLAGFTLLGVVAWRGRVNDAYDEVQR